jgi:hypothetical protein
MYTVQSTRLHRIELVIIKARTTGEINCISNRHTSCGLSHAPTTASTAHTDNPGSPL